MAVSLRLRLHPWYHRYTQDLLLPFFFVSLVSQEHPSDDAQVIRFLFRRPDFDLWDPVYSYCGEEGLSLCLAQAWLRLSHTQTWLRLSLAQTWLRFSLAQARLSLSLAQASPFGHGCD